MLIRRIFNQSLPDVQKANLQILQHAMVELLLIKEFAKRTDICDAFEGTMNSYCWVNIVR